MIERQKIARVAHLANCCYLTVCVDNPQNIADLEAAAAFENSTIHCLVEYEIGMKRCGVGTHEEFYALRLNTLKNQVRTIINLFGLVAEKAIRIYVGMI